jgi:hypothetical protein
MSVISLIHCLNKRSDCAKHGLELNHRLSRTPPISRDLTTSLRWSLCDLGCPSHVPELTALIPDVNLYIVTVDPERFRTLLDLEVRAWTDEAHVSCTSDEVTVKTPLALSGVGVTTLTSH